MRSKIANDIDFVKEIANVVTETDNNNDGLVPILKKHM